ncbi:MAG: MucR family transcriptional regulator [Amylibacter sp.]|nr:MucR family transcriptional regulator [Amylibacter sp.]
MDEQNKLDAETTYKDTLLALTAQIVSSHLSNAKLPTNEVPQFIETIHAKLKELSNAGDFKTRQKPALSVEASITPDFIYCLEDGKKFRMLKKHLRACYDMSPEEYRTKWCLSADYPMVAPNYAIKRQELAKQSGLGKKRA